MTSVTPTPFIVFFQEGENVLFSKAYMTSRAAKGQLTKLRKKPELQSATESGVAIYDELLPDSPIRLSVTVPTFPTV